MVKRYKNSRDLRHIRIRGKISGTNLIPRISVFRSNNFISAQIIDDQKGVTILQVSQKDIDSKQNLNKTQTAEYLGKKLALKAKEKGFKKAVFDRGGYQYHGRVKAFAEGLRSEGLEF